MTTSRRTPEAAILGGYAGFLAVISYALIHWSIAPAFLPVLVIPIFWAALRLPPRTHRIMSLLVVTALWWVDRHTGGQHGTGQQLGGSPLSLSLGIGLGTLLLIGELVRRTTGAGNEARYRDLFEASPEAMMVYDPITLRLLAVNNAALARYGYSRAEFLKLKATDLRPPDDLPAFHRILARVRGRGMYGGSAASSAARGSATNSSAAAPMASGVPLGIHRSGTARHRCKDGTVVWVDVMSHPVRFEERDARLVIAQDVSERRRVEGELRKLMAAAHCILWNAVVTEVDHHLEWDIRIVEVEAAQRLVPLDLARGETYDDAFRRNRLPEDAMRAEAHAAAALRSGQPGYKHEFRCRARGGVIQWLAEDVQIEPLSPGRWRLVGVCTDITGRKQSEEELHIVTSGARCILWNAIVVEKDGDFYWDLRIPEENAAAELLPLDVPEGGSYAETWFHCKLPEDVPQSEANFIESLRSGRNGYSHEFRCRQKDGSVRWFSEDVRISALEEGRWRFVGVCTDITDRQEAAQTLARAAEQAQAATRAKSQFVATMSHELRTPLNAVIGMTGLLLETPMTEDQREMAGTVRSSADALLSLINDILDFSKIESGRLELELLEFDLRQIVEDAVDLLAETAQRKGLEVGCLVHREVPEVVRGDPGRIRQILTNLISNAVKFTESGEVMIEVQLIPREAAGNHDYHFTVRDTGIGISAEARGRLFQAFTQADATTTRRYGGTGLGLTICRQLAEMMGGTIDFDSEPGRGSTFWFDLPLQSRTPDYRSSESRSSDCRSLDVYRRPSPEEQSEIIPGNDPALPLARVLVVDDNASSLGNMLYHLSTWGLDATGASNGSEALSLARRAADAGTPYQVAILDWQMQGMDGIALARAMDCDPRLGSIPRLLMGAVPSLDAEDRGAGKKEFAAQLSKPVRQRQLAASLARLLNADGASVPHLPGQRATPGADSSWKAVQSVSDCMPGGMGESLCDRLEDPPTFHARVLVAEDNIVNQKLAVKMLEKLGCRVDVAADGREALEAVTRIPYDLVLMDCQMPDMDGYRATAEIRKLGGEERLVLIVAMTANAMGGDRQRCLESGMDDYLAKPIRPGELEATLRRWRLDLEAPADPFWFSTDPVRQAAPAARPGVPEIGAAAAPGQGRTQVLAQQAALSCSGRQDVGCEDQDEGDPESRNCRYSDRVQEPMDYSVLESLRRLQQEGQPDILAELAATFLRDAAARLDSLRGWIETGDTSAVGRTAHSLKGSSSTIGAVGMAQICAGLEDAARSNVMADVVQLFGSLEEEFGHVRENLIAALPALRLSPPARDPG